MVNRVGACVLDDMGHCKGKDNVKKTAARRAKMERLRKDQQTEKKGK